MRSLASELQVMAALMAREITSFEGYMQAAATSWQLCTHRNYDGQDLVQTERDVQ